LQRIEDDEAGQARDFAARAAAALAPLTSLLVERAGPGVTNEIPIGRLAALTADALERICTDETGSLDALWGDEAGESICAAILLETRDSGSTLSMTGHEWIGALDALISGRMVKPRAGGHPRAFIWGALEARLQHVDTLLGALNEGVWPQAGQEDPFLSRSMKAAIGPGAARTADRPGGA
jgi:ATP-dependent helicase/nuclease subunit B